MPFVLTVDQRRSRHGPDLVDTTIDEIGTLAGSVTLPFERTAGDEFQGVVGSAADAVAVALRLVRDGRWSIGIGVGPIEEGRSARASRGPAFLAARAAVDEAKQRTHRVAIFGPADEQASEAEFRGSRSGQADALITMLAAVITRRTDAGWEAVDLVEAGNSIAEAAAKLGVTRQAVGQRLGVALWREEIDVRHVAVRLLSEAEESA